MTALDDMRAAIRAAPDDLEMRRVYADALLQQDDPRGEWIALCCAPGDETDDAEMRRRALWQAHGNAWRSEDIGQQQPGARIGVQYQRGFPHTADLPLEDALALAPRLAAHPLHALAVSALEPAGIAPLAKSPVMTSLRKLELGYGLEKLETDHIVELVDAAPNLTELAFTPHQDCPRVWDALHRIARISELVDLELRSLAVSRDAAAWLARAMPKLTGLDVWYGLTAAAVRELCSSRLRLTTLRIMDHDGMYGRTRQLEDDAVADLLRSPVISRLTYLGLDSCPLGDASAEAFAELSCATTLTDLRIWATPRAHHIMGALREATLPALRTLDLWMNFASESDIAALVRYPTLRSLVAGRNTVSADTVRKLVAALPVLERLSVVETSAGDASIYAILESSCARTLRRLELQVAGITGDGAKALAESSIAENLRELDLYGNALGAAAVRALAAAPFDRMAELVVGDTMRGDTAAIFADGWLPLPDSHDKYERKLDLSGKPVAPAAPKRTHAKKPKQPAPARKLDPEGDHQVGERVDAGERGIGVVSEIAPTFIAVKFRTSGELRWQRIPPDAIAYTIKRRFAVGEFVKHPTFGAGTVRAATHDRVEIEFWSEGVKTLVHARP